MPTSKLNDPTKQSEARDFSLALVTHKDVLVAYSKTLADNASDPEAAIAAADDFIQHKRKNGLKDYQTDQAYVLQAQQTLPTYVLLYWSGFYTTQLADSKAPQALSEGPSFVIAATLDSAAPVHVGLGRDQIIEPVFETLILQWVKSDVQRSSAKLIFNLVPDENGNVRRTFAGSYDDGSGNTKLLTGVASPQPETQKQKDDQKAALPPALQVIYPTIAAIGTLVALVTGTVGMAWVIRQWRDRSIKAREAAENARANPENRDLARAAEAARGDAQAAENAAQAVGDPLRVAAERADALPEPVADAAAAAVVGDGAVVRPPVEPGPALEVVRAAVVDSPVLQQAAAQLAEQQPPDPIVRSEAPEPGSEFSDGLLSEPTIAGED